jgi:hypothetical protein
MTVQKGGITTGNSEDTEKTFIDFKALSLCSGHFEFCESIKSDIRKI